MPQDSYEIWLKALRKRLAAAAAEAEPLVAQGRLDEAEQMVRAVDGDIYGAVALGDLFTNALRAHVTGPQPDRARADELYQRALRWRSASPTPHTAEEAERDRSHADQVRQELTAILAGGSN